MLNKQNDDSSIQLLKAMRLSYDKAKSIRILKLTISLGLPIFSIIFSFLLKNQVVKIISIISSLWIFVVYFVKNFEMDYLIQGAKIQEKFDTYIFDIPWNKILIGGKIKKEDIFELSKASKGNNENVTDWYKGLESKHKIINILIAQRTNLVWGFSLKKIYLRIVWAMLIIYIILTAGIGCFLEMSLKDYLIALLIPSVSLGIYMIEIIINLTSQKNKVSDMIDLIEAECRKIIKNKKFNDFNICRNIQDFIYLETRVNGVLVPNFLYNFRKKNEEEKMLQINKDLSKL